MVLGVRTAYFTARRRCASCVEVARETLDNQERHLKQIDGHVRVGARPEIDRAQARADRATAEAAYIAARTPTRSPRRSSTSRWASRADSTTTSSRARSRPSTARTSRPTALVDEAVRARPELLALAEQLRASELTVSSAKGAYGPSLGASMSLTDAGTDINKLAWNWNVGVGADAGRCSRGCSRARRSRRRTRT